MQSHNYSLVHEHIEKIMPLVERPAGGKVLFPYLSCSYGQHYAGVVFGWDHHHMGMRFAYAGKPQYQRYLIDNLLAHQTSDGCTPNCVTADGPCAFFPQFHAQPFLMQGALMYLDRTGDLPWAQERFDPLKRYLSYYETSCSAPFGLFRWPLSWMSGFDNDVVTTFFQPDTIISADLSSWLYLECRSAAQLAKRLGRTDDHTTYAGKAKQLRATINRMLWYDELDSYSALNLCTGRPQFHLSDPLLDRSVGYYAFQTCSNLIPLYARIADPQQARRMIERYVLNNKHFRSPYGIRSLSGSSEYYNNAIWGNPPRFGSHLRLTNSNWQGPVWVPLAYFMFQALLHYGFAQEAHDLAERTMRVLAECLEKTGYFTENFHAETGEPLYAPQFASWNILADLMRPEDGGKDWIMTPVFQDL